MWASGGQCGVRAMSSPDISDTVPHAPELPSNPARSGSTHKIWPEAVVAFGFGLTAGWIILLGYGVVFLGSGFVRLVELAI